MNNVKTVSLTKKTALMRTILMQATESVLPVKQKKIHTKKMIKYHKYIKIKIRQRKNTIGYKVFLSKIIHYE